MKKLEFRNRWTGEVLSGAIEVNRYAAGDGVALELWVESEYCYEPYASMTVNLNRPASEGCAYLDVNNFPEGVNLMAAYDLGVFTGWVKRSGFCEYPEYRLNMDEIAKYAMEL